MVVPLSGPQGRDGGQNSAYRPAVTFFMLDRVAPTGMQCLAWAGSLRQCVVRYRAEWLCIL